ncbi:MAG: YHS domain-containing protein [Candidatus Brocadiales bacterium]
MKLYLRLMLLPLFVLTISFVNFYATPGGVTVQAAEEKVLDPACGMEIDKSSAIAVEYEGDTYYFCSEMCKTKFEKNPEKMACVCAAGEMSGCKCGHCQKTADKCSCGSEEKGHEGGEHNH